MITERTDHEGHVFETISEMCDYWGMSKQTYLQRIHKGGLTMKEALTLDSQHHKSRSIQMTNPYDGRTMSVNEWAKEFNQYRTIWATMDVDGHWYTKCILIEPDKSLYNIKYRDYSFEEAFLILPSLISTTNFELTDDIFIIEPKIEDNGRTSRTMLLCVIYGREEYISKNDLIKLYRGTPYAHEVYQGWLDYYHKIRNH